MPLTQYFPNNFCYIYIHIIIYIRWQYIYITSTWSYACTKPVMIHLARFRNYCASAKLITIDSPTTTHSDSKMSVKPLRTVANTTSHLLYQKQRK